MKILPLLGAVALLSLAACNSDGTVDQAVVSKVATAVNDTLIVACQIDSTVPGQLTAATVVVSIAAPQDVAAVAALSQADQLIHPAVVNACKAVSDSATVKSVSVVPATPAP